MALYRLRLHERQKVLSGVALLGACEQDPLGVLCSAATIILTTSDGGCHWA